MRSAVGWERVLLLGLTAATRTRLTGSGRTSAQWSTKSSVAEVLVAGGRGGIRPGVRFGGFQHRPKTANRRDRILLIGRLHRHHGDHVVVGKIQGHPRIAPIEPDRRDHGPWQLPPPEQVPD